MGAAKACADMGADSKAAMRKHNVRWEVKNGTASYTALPTQVVTVNGAKAVVTVPDKVTCSLGGRCVIMEITASAVPYGEVKVSLIASIADDKAKTDNSAGITPNAGEVATLKVGSNQGILGFACAAEVKGTKLKYKIDGSSKDVFTLSSAEVTVTSVKAGDKPTDVKYNLAKVDAKSTAGSTTVEGTCPGLGNSYISLRLYADKAAPLTSATDVKNAAAKFVKKTENQHKELQWCS